MMDELHTVVPGKMNASRNEKFTRQKRLVSFLVTSSSVRVNSAGGHVALGKTMGLEVTEEDICELVEGHDQRLSTQELVKLQAEATEEQASLGEEEEPGEEQLSTTKLKDILQQWQNVQTYAQRHHPDKSLAHDLAKIFDTRVMSSFRGVLKRRQKQLTMERFLTKKQREEPAASTSSTQLPSSSFSLSSQKP